MNPFKFRRETIERAFPLQAKYTLPAPIIEGFIDFPFGFFIMYVDLFYALMFF